MLLVSFIPFLLLMEQLLLKGFYRLVSLLIQGLCGFFYGICSYESYLRRKPPSRFEFSTVFFFFMVSITCVFFLFPNLCLQDRIRTEFPIGDGIIATSACVNYFLVWNSWICNGCLIHLHWPNNNLCYPFSPNILEWTELTFTFVLMKAGKWLC